MDSSLPKAGVEPLDTHWRPCPDRHFTIAFPPNNDRIVIDPAVCNARPIVRGTRITAQTVLEFPGAGDSVEDVLDEYPTLTRDDVLACLHFSSRLMGNHSAIEKVA